MKHDQRVLLIGFDGMLSGLIRKFRKVLPNIGRLIDEGVFGEALSCMPTDTPTNWTTIATGADTRTHRVDGFLRDSKGKPVAHFDSRRCQAEFLWEAVERAGKQAILLNYPTSWPLRTKKCTVVGGDGIFSPTWRIGDLVVYSTETADRESSRTIFFDILRTDVRIELREAGGWSNVPESSKPPLEAVIPSVERKTASWSNQGFATAATDEGRASGQYHLLVTASGAGGYDTVRLAPGRDAASSLCCLHAGEWSGWIYQDFPVNDRPVPGSFKFKLLELSPDGKRMRLYRSMVSAVNGWTHPPELAGELIDRIGPYHEGWENSPMEMAAELGLDTLVEHARMQADWVANAAAYLAKRENWDLLMVQVHIQDSYNHRFLNYLEPLCAGYSREAEEKIWQLFEELYRITDTMVGEIAGACADKNTTVFLVSDHGCFPVHTRVCVDAFLLKSGLFDAGYDPATGSFSLKMIPSGLAGAALETARDRVIEVLHSIRDPRTGLSPISLAVRREDMFWPAEDTAGDSGVAYFFKGGYIAQTLPAGREELDNWLSDGKFFFPASWSVHQGLPTVHIGEFSNKATFIISGRAVTTGNQPAEPISQKDICPTICHLLGINPPRHSEGRILWDVLVQEPGSRGADSRGKKAE